MDRFALRVTLTFAALAFASSARAQPLPTLHVRGFALALDRTSVNVGQAFHLSLKTHVDERLSALDNVVLPNLSGLEDLGDERRCSASKNGTDCVETLTLDAQDPGDRTIGPATRCGKNVIKQPRDDSRHGSAPDEQRGPGARLLFGRRRRGRTRCHHLHSRRRRRVGAPLGFRPASRETGAADRRATASARATTRRTC